MIMIMLRDLLSSFLAAPCWFSMVFSVGVEGSGFVWVKRTTVLTVSVCGGGATGVASGLPGVGVMGVLELVGMLEVVVVLEGVVDRVLLLPPPRSGGIDKLIRGPRPVYKMYERQSEKASVKTTGEV
jgi:hypothetical protein